MEPCRGEMADQNYENNPRDGTNWKHFVDAYGIYNRFLEQHFSESLKQNRESDRESYVPLDQIQVADENKLLPLEGYLSFYCDLLGSSAEVLDDGPDSLRDFYGAAYISACENPNIQVFLLSDSCLAFAPKEYADNFLIFASSLFGRWLADGMLPQCFLGFGSFVERRPDFGLRPANFLGTQVTGTALVDAANIQKNDRPLGSRIFVSPSALRNLPLSVQIVIDGRGSLELLSNRPKQFCLFDCIYYLLCLRTQRPGTRAFKHFVWSAASRIMSGGEGVLKIAQELARPLFDKGELNEILGSIRSVISSYETRPPSKV